MNVICKSEAEPALDFPKFSVLMAVYINDDPAYFARALESIVKQTVCPDEVVIIKNGPLTDEHEKWLAFYGRGNNIQQISFSENRGLAVALNKGVTYCSNELIARMDADDISCSNRFELQIEKFRQNPELDVVGGLISEFLYSEDQESAKRYVKESHESIVGSSKFYCPMNHVTVMFRRSAVLLAGNYQDFRGVEDYPLWVSMIMVGCKFYNIQEVLVKVRVAGLNNRRAGFEYARMEFNVMKYFYLVRYYSLPMFFLMSISRFSVRVFGSFFRGVVYRLTRSK
ncbi:glycosyltransferase [Teredinibacter franksiae]|uniref:glycosyltransferase n=1 Tax=Teredinibacter franksiae TaxID=2761453 RepID=UPI001626574F|nr:glycosyltransferase [Teredinibacter franksiae]